MNTHLPKFKRTTQAARGSVLPASSVTETKLHAALLTTLAAKAKQARDAVDLTESYVQMYLSQAKEARLPLEELRESRALYESDREAVLVQVRERVAPALLAAQALVGRLENQVPSDELGDPDEVAALCEAMANVAAIQQAHGTPEEVTALFEAMDNVGRLLQLEAAQQSRLRVFEIQASNELGRLPALRVACADAEATLNKARRAAR